LIRIRSPDRIRLAAVGGVVDEREYVSCVSIDTSYHARANGHITGATVGVLGISTDDTVRQTFSLKVTDMPMETESSVSPSDAAALRMMLEHRVDRAVVNEACDTSAIAKAAALAAQKVENARQVLDLLRVGAELAEQHGETPVTDDHIETARERVQRGRVAKVIRGQTEYV
jgi:cell division control protein 6